MHNCDNKYPTRSGFEPSNSRASSHSQIEWAIGAVSLFQAQKILIVFLLMLHELYINMINRVWDLP